MMDIKSVTLRKAEEMILSRAGQDIFFCKIWNKGPSSLKWILQDVIYRDSLCLAFSDLYCFDELSDAMNQYLEKLPTTPTIKNRYRSYFLSLLSSISKDYNLGLSEHDCDQKLNTYITEDTNIKLIKELHVQEGKSLSELSEALGIKEDSINDRLDWLDPDLRSRKHKDQLWAGQVLHPHIEYHERKDANRGQTKKYYYTPDTVHPVAFQLNVLQTASLLQSLCYAYNSGVSRVTLNIAADLWLQLSDYCKTRIRTIFCPGNQDLSDYLDRLDDLASCKDKLEFFEEGVMDYGEEHMSMTERLISALKGDYCCDIFLLQDDRELVLNDVSVRMSNNGRRRFFATPYGANSEDERCVYFSPEEVKRINLLH